MWPAFTIDIVSLVTVLATQAEGRTLLHDWMYELRLFALEQPAQWAPTCSSATLTAHRHRQDAPGGRALDSRDIRSGMR